MKIKQYTITENNQINKINLFLDILGLILNFV